MLCVCFPLGMGAPTVTAAACCYRCVVGVGVEVFLGGVELVCSCRCPRITLEATYHSPRCRCLGGWYSDPGVVTAAAGCLARLPCITAPSKRRSAFWHTARPHRLTQAASESGVCAGWLHASGH
jgi:hypothetical protein